MATDWGWSPRPAVSAARPSGTYVRGHCWKLVTERVACRMMVDPSGLAMIVACEGRTVAVQIEEDLVRNDCRHRSLEAGPLRTLG